uniref:Uncharacterized protein n=1 Tax=Lygus hesperus TaxID=30085 RepID=A0A146LAI9_LYGHE
MPGLHKAISYQRQTRLVAQSQLHTFLHHKLALLAMLQQHWNRPLPLLDNINSNSNGYRSAPTTNSRQTLQRWTTSIVTATVTGAPQPLTVVKHCRGGQHQ